MTPEQEILDPAFTSRSEALPVVRKALRHFNEAKRATIQVMADLRLLQDRGAHHLYGERNFATWAEQTFEGLSAGSVKQLTRAGGVALELDRRGRINLDKPSGIGTTGLRSLSVIANEYGNAKMVEVFDTAKELVEEGREISDTTIKAAMYQLMPPAPAELEVPPALDEDDGEEELDDPVMRTELEERISHIQDLLWDLGDADPDEFKRLHSELMQEMAKLIDVKDGKSDKSDEQWLSKGR